MESLCECRSCICIFAYVQPAARQRKLKLRSVFEPIDRIVQKKKVRARKAFNALFLTQLVKCCSTKISYYII
jgi:hypothetical protein